MSFTNEF